MLPGAYRQAYFRAGKWRIYWRADRSRGAPVLWQGSAATRAEAETLERDAAPQIAERYAATAHPRAAHGYVARLIEDFRASDVWRDLAPRTQTLWGRHLDHIADVFGQTSLAAIQRRGARKLIKAWHQKMAAHPRKANTALTVLVRLFAYGLDVEDMDRNPAAKISRLDEGPGRSAIVWTPEEFAALMNARSADGDELLGPARRRALRLCWLTGLRREDLVRLRWDEIDEAARLIRRRTLKSRRKGRIARINLEGELAELIGDFRAAAAAFIAAGRPPAVTVVTTETGGVYSSAEAFSKAILRAFDAADVRAEDGRRKHLHDMRGTRVSLRFAEGCSDAEAEAMFAWAPGSGGKMRGIYGDEETIARAAGRRLRSVG